MRIVKEAEERRNEILDAADELFGRKGFDGTSTNDILEKVGIARGTLYYHFKSKEDILDALIQRYEDQMYSAAAAAAKYGSLPVTERLIRVVLAMNVSQNGGKALVEQMHKPQNALMHQKTQQLTLTRLTPVLTGLIEEGIREGLFSTPYPAECMEMTMAYATTFFDDAMDMSEEERSQRIRAFIFNMERLLGTENGRLASCMLRMFDRNPVPASDTDE